MFERSHLTAAPRDTANEQARKRACLALCLLLTLAACSALRPHEWVLTRLYLGQMRGAAQIGPPDLEAFIAEEVTTAYPAGFTRYEARGQWRDPAGRIVREPTVVLEIAHPESADDEARLARIVTRYRDRFGQEAVLRIDTAIGKIAL